MPKRASIRGRGADIFFGAEPEPLSQSDEAATLSSAVSEQFDDQAPAPAAIRAIHPAPASQPATELDSKLASMLAAPDDAIETIRKAVKVAGKEVSFVRLTPEEKGQLADIIYTYKRQGKKTTENEISRIAVNYIVHDYRANGEQSILARVIDALLA